MSSAFLQAVLRRAVGADVVVTATRPVSGGCIHQAARVDTSEGPFFAKWNAGCAPDLFLREAEGLNALHGACSDLVVPRVIAAAEPTPDAPAFLLLEYLAPAARAPDDERLGRGLATIHRATATRFGFPSPTYCGATRQDNTGHDGWPPFYGERRLTPLVQLLARQGLPADDRRVYERVAERLPRLVAPDAPPSLIHGDLWSGNVMSTGRGPALVDPACAYADREMEFGISTLFGGLSARAMAAYEEAWPLPAGWRERNGLYQLYHLLNHALLFGGHYAGDARRVAERYL